MGNANTKDDDEPISEEVMTYVDAQIAAKKVVVFHKWYCPYCIRAKWLLAEYIPRLVSEEEYDLIEIYGRPDMWEIQRYLKKITGGSTVPRIFIDGESVGGSDNLNVLHKEEKLEAMMKAA